MKTNLLIAAFMCASIACLAQKNVGYETITSKALQAKVAFLASDLIEGREAGERGNFIASEYIAAKFCELGLTPFNSEDNGILTKYIQPFSSIKISDQTSQITLVSGEVSSIFSSGVDFYVAGGLIVSDVRIAGKVAFYDSKLIDYSNKIVVINSSKSIKEIKFDSIVGARAIIVYDSLAWNKQIAEKAVTYHYNEAIYEGPSPRKVFKDSRLVLENSESSVPVLHVSPRVFNKLEKSSVARISLNVKCERKYLRNVIGMIEGELKDEYVVIGTHFDHYGVQNGYIYNGADDNASGTAAVMQIAEAFVRSGEKPKRTIVFALWDGEERGLLGSKFYTQDVNTLSKVKAYMNFDMIGRNTDAPKPETFAFMYTEAYPIFADWMKKSVKEYKLNLNPNYAPWDKPVGGSDNASFAVHEIPIIWYHTGGHPDYHQPSDHVELINWSKMLDITRTAYLIFYNMANEEIVKQ